VHKYGLVQNRNRPLGERYIYIKTYIATKRTDPKTFIAINYDNSTLAFLEFQERYGT